MDKWKNKENNPLINHKEREERKKVKKVKKRIKEEEKIRQGFSW